MSIPLPPGVCVFSDSIQDEIYFNETKIYNEFVFFIYWIYVYMYFFEI